MPTLECILLAVACFCGGAGITNAIWLGVHRRYVTWSRERLDWWYEYSGRILQSSRNMTAIAKRAIAQGDWYRDYLAGKIVIDDPSAPPCNKRGGQA